MGQPTVSVILPVYRPNGVFYGLLKDVLAQQCEFLFEVVIVDDGSPKRFCESLQRRISELGDPRLHLFFKEQNGGPASARNEAISQAKGDVYCLFDSDCRLPDKKHLSRLFALHCVHPNAIIGGAQRPLRESYVSWTEHFCRGGRCKAGKRASRIHKGHVVTSHMIFSKRTWQQVGPFSEELRTGEDVAFCQLALKKNIEVRQHGELIVLHENSRRVGRFLRRNYLLGKDRALSRQVSMGHCPWYLRGTQTIRLALVVPIALGLTLKHTWESMRHLRVFFSLPLLFLGMLSMALGVARGGQVRT